MDRTIEAPRYWLVTIALLDDEFYVWILTGDTVKVI
jgi:hypothetical protein